MREISSFDSNIRFSKLLGQVFLVLACFALSYTCVADGDENAEVTESPCDVNQITGHWKMTNAQEAMFLNYTEEILVEDNWSFMQLTDYSWQGLYCPTKTKGYIISCTEVKDPSLNTVTVHDYEISVMVASTQPLVEPQSAEVQKECASRVRYMRQFQGDTIPILVRVIGDLMILDPDTAYSVTFMRADENQEEEDNDLDDL